MKKIFFILFLLFSAGILEAQQINTHPTQEFYKQHLDQNIPIVDIRTPPEWKQTGILKGAIPIMFFDERGNYDIRGFLQKLNEKVDTKKPFAIICHTGNRTSMLAPFLSEQLGYTVYNLIGGMDEAAKNHLPIVPYKKQ
ncbi:MAG: rhodanese-like domain-containing protein [Epsilonproteobacteria bacterium]|nr:rhodanese-like domain-containing protein [Campylobacterota bacterium]